MVKSNEEAKSLRKYQKIDKEQRRLVLELLMKEKLSLQEVQKYSPPNIYISFINHFQPYSYAQVANKLQLKYCTVRTIQKAYENEGRIGKKETRKRKLRVENILKIQIVHPFTLALSPPIVSSEVSQIYIDKEPTPQDQIALSQEQRQLLNQQCHKYFQMLYLECTKSQQVPNPYYQTIMKNLHMASSLIFKQLLEVKQQEAPIKQEYDPQTPTMTQPPVQFQHFPYLFQFAPFFSMMRT